MARYQFSTVKLVPDLAKDEPVNIGVILFDQEENKAYPKFTRNWKAVSERTGVDRLPNLKQIIEIKTIKTEANYLTNLSHKKFQDNLIITNPKTISILEHPQATLETLFETQISIPQLDTIEDKRLNRFGRWVEKIITQMDFPEKSYEPNYVFKNTMIEKRYPYVFFRKQFPYLSIDYLSFLSTTLIVNTKVKSFDIRMILESQVSHKTQFKIFASQEKDQINIGEKKIKKSFELLDFFKIPVIFKNDSEYELDKIRKEAVVTAV